MAAGMTMTRNLRSETPAIIAWRSAAAEALARVGESAEARRLAAREVELTRSFGAPRALGLRCGPPVSSRVTSMESNADPGYNNAYRPEAELTMTLQDLLGTENGCDSTGESDVDNDCGTTGTDGDGQNLFGEFDDEALVTTGRTPTTRCWGERPGPGYGRHRRRRSAPA